MTEMLTSGEACERLGVRPQTLYAYVSRGLLTPTKDGRRSFFAAPQVDALARRTARGRRPGRFEVNIETAITLLDPRGRLLYRGVDVSGLANRWSYERVAQWLWTGVDEGEPPASWAADDTAVALARRVQAELGSDTRLDDRLRVAVATIAANRRRARMDARHEPQLLIATLVEALPTLKPSARASGDSIAARLWPRLGPLAPTAARVRALDTAMVLLADHELATSTLAARVAASTWADRYEVVLAGLATISGPLHGGSQRLVRGVLRDAYAVGPRAALANALERYGTVPGSGHVVYRDGDPRAALLLPVLRASVPEGRLDVVDELMRTMRRRRLGPINGDFALAALTDVHQMIDGAGEAIMAVARIAGWLAHAAEESAHRLRFRPRAIYTGPRP